MCCDTEAQHGQFRTDPHQRHRRQAGDFDGYDSLPALRQAEADPELIGLMLLTVEDAVIGYVARLDLPVALVNGDDPQMRIRSVTPCNRSAAGLGTRHLMQMGHRRILFPTRPGRRIELACRLIARDSTAAAAR